MNPPKAMSYTEVARRLCPIQPIPEGAMTAYLDHMFKEDSDLKGIHPRQPRLTPSRTYEVKP